MTIRRSSTFFVIAALGFLAAASFAIYYVYAAQEVILNDSNYYADHHHTNQNLLVVVDDDEYYSFFAVSDAGSFDCAMTSSTDGRTTWAPFRNLRGGAVANTCRGTPNVWYDKWTPGDSGSKIHLLSFDTNNLWYVEVDTATGAASDPEDISTAIDNGSYGNTNQASTLTKGTDGDLYATITDNDSNTILKCSANCTSAANWSDAGQVISVVNGGNHKVRLMPLAGGDIMLIHHDYTNDQLLSYIYDDSEGTWGNTTTIYSNVQALAWSAHDNSQGAMLNATLDRDTNNIYVGFNVQDGTETTHDAGDELWTAFYSGGTWSTSTAKVVDGSDGSGVRSVHMTYDEANDEVYVFFSHGTDQTALNYYYKKSSDNMTSWTATSTALADANFDRLIGWGSANMVTDAMVYFMWGLIGANETLYGSVIADVTANTVPTIIDIYPAQGAAGTVTVTTTIADVNSDVTGLTVEHSVDNSTWVSSTIRTVSEAGEGNGVTTSTGYIAGIDTDNDGSVNLTFEWDIAADLPTTDDTSVYFRIIADDTTVSSTAQTSDAFSVDTKDPTAPGALTVNTTSTQSMIFAFGSATVDNSFEDYKIYFTSSTSPVTTSDSSHTSTTDANLGLINFNGASTTTISGMATNTQYIANIWAFDSFERNTSSTSEITFYTAAAVPTSASATADSDTQITVSWGANGNTTTTEYYVEDVNDAARNSGWTTATSYAFISLTAETEYTFKVKARNGDNIETAYSDTTAATTDAAASSGGGGGGGGAVIRPRRQLSLGNNSQIRLLSTPAVDVRRGEAADGPGAKGNAARHAQVRAVYSGSGQRIPIVLKQTQQHTVVLNRTANKRGFFTVFSDPIDFDLAEGEETTVDIDGDGVADMHAYAENISDEKDVEIVLTALDELPVVIQDGYSKTASQHVQVRLQSVPDVESVVLSEDPDFEGASFQPYASSIGFQLSPGAGEKTVYVKFKDVHGAVAVVSDNIILTEVACDLSAQRAYKHTQSTGVYYITEACAKRAFTRPEIFFTYFESWEDVSLASQEAIEAIPDDALGFMPWGPLFDPQYGALVKITSDPKVYLLLGGNKHWITNAAIFENLGYQWHWIEDIDPRLLDSYVTQGEITDTTRHPNYTLVKYEHDSKVYRLEPDPDADFRTIKRHITDERTFRTLNYRSDRIVIIPDTEQYDDGPALTIADVSEADGGILRAVMHFLRRW